MSDVACYGGCSSTHTGAPDDENQRRWCHACREWCYPGDPDMLCARGAEVYLRKRAEKAEAEVARYRSSCGEALCRDVERDRDFYQAEVERLKAAYARLVERRRLAAPSDDGHTLPDGEARCLLDPVCFHVKWWRIPCVHCARIRSGGSP